jgi:hypothetical protein
MTPDDQQWLEDAFKRVLPKEHPIHQMTPGHVELSEDDLKLAARLGASLQPREPKLWKFGG